MSMQLSSRSVRRHLILAAAGLGALAFIPRAGAGQQGATSPQDPNANSAPNQTAQNQVAQAPRLPDGFTQKDEAAADGVKSTLVGLTNRAVTKDSYDSFFSSFLGELAKRDKARSQEFKNPDQAVLNITIARIQTEWRAKYNQDFGITNTDLAFYSQYPIVQGEVSDASAAANSWSAVATADQAVVAGVNSVQQQRNTKELTKGRAVAIVRIPAGDGLPDIDVSMLHQSLSGWYVDLPADRSGEQIYNDLSAHLTYITSHQDKWPDSINAGYQMMARSVVGALYGVSYAGGTASAQ